MSRHEPLKRRRRGLIVVGTLGDVRRLQRGGPGQPVDAAELERELALPP